MDKGPFFVDGKHISAEECQKIFLGARLDDRQRRCLEWIEGQVVIDIGCYGGSFVDAAVKYFPSKRVLGVDYDTENLRIARFLYPEHSFVHSSVYALEMADDSVDCVTFQEVLEHLEGAAMAIKEINRILKPGGVLILSTPHSYYWRDIAAFVAHEIANRFRGRRHLKDAIYYADIEWNRHIYCWTPSTLLTLLISNGFEYVDHQFSADARGKIESLFLWMFPFFGPAQIIKVRKKSEAPRKII